MKERNDMKKIIAASLLTIAACTPAAEVYEQTFNGRNIIYNYEWFYDANAQVQSKARAISDHAKLVSSAEGSESSRLQMELTGMRNVCRDLVQEYNANSQKANRALFKANDIPDQLSMDKCEG